MSYYLLEAPAYSTFGYFADVEKRIEASSNEDAREIATITVKARPDSP